MSLRTRPATPATQRLRRASIAAAAAAALAVALGPTAAAADATAASDGAPFVVKIHADWCGTCTRLNPTWEALQRELGHRARLVVLDVTDRDSLARAEAEAKRLGLESFLAAHRGKTGTIGVLHGESREVIELFQGELETAPYVAAVERARS